MESQFRFQLESALEEERRALRSEANWVRVREVETETGRSFADLVHELRLTHEPEEVPAILGVTRGFLYEHFGWAMDKVAYVERRYGAPLGEAVLQRRAQGSTMAAIAREWGLAKTTLYKAVKRV